jgi:hypothetical protein
MNFLALTLLRLKSSLHGLIPPSSNPSCALRRINRHSGSSTAFALCEPAHGGSFSACRRTRVPRGLAEHLSAAQSAKNAKDRLTSKQYIALHSILSSCFFHSIKLFACKSFQLFHPFDVENSVFTTSCVLSHFHPQSKKHVIYY